MTHQIHDTLIPNPIYDGPVYDSILQPTNLERMVEEQPTKAAIAGTGADESSNAQPYCTPALSQESPPPNTARYARQPTQSMSISGEPMPAKSGAQQTSRSTKNFESEDEQKLAINCPPEDDAQQPDAKLGCATSTSTPKLSPLLGDESITIVESAGVDDTYTLMSPTDTTAHLVNTAGWNQEGKES